MAKKKDIEQKIDEILEIVKFIKNRMVSQNSVDSLKSDVDDLRLEPSAQIA